MFKKNRLFFRLYSDEILSLQHLSFLSQNIFFLSLQSNNDEFMHKGAL